MSAQASKPFTNMLLASTGETNQSVITEIMTLNKVIRQGLQPDSPELMQRYQLLGDLYAHSEPGHTFSIYFLLFNTLLDTATDNTIQMQWRQVCLNHIYRPLMAMEKTATSEQEKRQVRELRRSLAISTVI